jgi:hypothetical protein
MWLLIRSNQVLKPGQISKIDITAFQIDMRLAGGVWTGKTREAGAEPLCAWSNPGSLCIAKDAITRFQAKPMDDEAAKAMEDPEYYRGLVEYGKKTADLLNPIWEEKIYPADSAGKK